MSHEVRVARTRYELAELLAPVRARGERVGLVPTMGALHVGHTSLIDRARTEAATETGPGAVVVSIFVNPMQFAAGEDLDRYPRTFAEDLELCAAHGADVVFAPAVEEMYPHGVPDPERPTGVTVDPGPLAAVLEGASRPTHFRGVLTVVAKLFGLVAPDLAVFGEKDYQQLVLIRRMAADLCQGVEVIGAPTVREPDGLALSSRNRYLDPDERTRATALVRTLTAAVEEARYGLPAVLDAARGQLRASRGVDLDYLVVADAETLADLEKQPQPPPAGTSARILIAARVGSTRLIDNLPLTF